ncbi:MAG: exosome protein [Methanomassiliicoccaceae archaeon]|nr:exosome protein [Methanomassiliicoccaceae archaeon]
MQGTFHWFRINVFCYATENEELIHDVMAELLGTDEFECDVSNSEHGNRILVLSGELSKDKEIIPVFLKMGKDVADELKACLEERIDDECVFYLRLDKQELVQGRYIPAHHGDVLSVTGKITSHPARKAIAVEKMAAFLNSLEFPEN